MSPLTKLWVLTMKVIMKQLRKNPQRILQALQSMFLQVGLAVERELHPGEPHLPSVESIMLKSPPPPPAFCSFIYLFFLSLLGYWKSELNSWTPKQLLISQAHQILGWGGSLLQELISGLQIAVICCWKLLEFFLIGVRIW